MTNSLFSATKDREVIEASGFLCQSCLVGKSLDDQSPDSRYCQFCFEVLLEEIKETPVRGKQGWRPVPRRALTLPVKEKPVAKPSLNEILPAEKPVEVMQHKKRGGRPRKEGEVHRTTEWRRQKAEQGVLL